MPLGNYREVPLRLNGQDIRIGGFRRPDELGVFTTLKDTHGVEAVISLTDDFSQFFNSSGMPAGFYTHGPSVEVFDWFDTPFEGTARIPPTIYDAIYDAVTTAQAAGKKIAIHCGAGDGRTGTALSSLMLRELLEEAHHSNPIDFDAVQGKTQTIHMHHGVNGSGHGEVTVTPFVKRAIEEVRMRSGHHTSVESRNDVESLMLYEQHLRAQLVLKHTAQLGEPQAHTVATAIPGVNPELEAQVNAAASAIDEGIPQVKESYVSQILDGLLRLWDYIKEATNNIKESIMGMVR
jgi:hypothetical protein